MRRYHPAIYIFLFCFSAAMQGQILNLRAELSEDTILIGDQVSFNLVAEMEQSVQVEFPIPADTLSKAIEVLLFSPVDTVIRQDRKTISRSYLITSFEKGTHVVPAQKIVYNTGVFSDTALTMPLLIHVLAPEVDTAQAIKPIKPPINTPVTFAEAVPWILISFGGLMGLALIIALVRMFARRKKDPEVFAAMKLEPPHIVAFRELDRLKEEKLWEKGKVKEFYTRLTEIVRTYIERQYGIPAMESTTEEILKTFDNLNTEDEVLNEMLRELLSLADLVKFAKEDPLPVENQTNLNNGYLFVQKTYPLFYREEWKLKEEVTDEAH